MLKRALQQLVVLVFFAALAVGFTWPLTRHLSTHTADVGVDDPLLYARLLRHFLAWLAGHRTGLLDVDFFFPHPKALTTHDASLGILYGALPFLPFTRDLLTLVNLGVLITFVLSAHPTYLLVRRLTESDWAGLVAAVAFGFCLYRLHQLDHLNVLQMQWLVYGIWLMVLLGEAPSPLKALLLAAVMVVHGTASMNIALYSLFALLAVAIWVVAKAAPDRRKAVFGYGAAAALLAGVVLTPLYRAYVLAGRVTGVVRDLGEVQMYSGRVEQLRAAPIYNWLYGASGASLMGSESLVFPGWSILALAVLGFALTAFGFLRVSKGRAALLGGAAFLVIGGLGYLALHSAYLALGLSLSLCGVAIWIAWKKEAPHSASGAWLLAGVGCFYLFSSFGPMVQWGTKRLGPGLWTMVSRLPGYSWVRTPSRLFFVSSLALAVLAGLGVAELSKRLRPRHSVWLGLFVLLAVAADVNTAPLPLRRMHTLSEAPPVYRYLAMQPGRGAVVELPVIQADERYRMYFSVLHQRPTVDAESGFPLPVLHWINNSSFLMGRATASLERLRTAGLEYAVLHTDRLGARNLELYRRTLTQAGAALASSLGRDEVWRFAPLHDVRPFSLETTKLTEWTFEAPTSSSVAGRALKVGLRFQPRGDFGVFEFALRTLTLHVRGEGVDKEVPVYLSPPLIAPGQTEEVVVEVPITAARAGSLALELVSESGQLWEQLRIAQLPSGAEP
jgi:hypothetical protein